MIWLSSLIGLALVFGGISLAFKLFGRRAAVQTREELKVDRDAAGFTLSFIAIWLVLTPRVDFAVYFGEWSGTAYALCIALLYVAARFVGQYRNRAKAQVDSSASLS